MKLEITRGSKVVKTYDTTIERDYLSRNDRDVTNNRAAEVVLKHVEVKTKKVTAPVHHEDKSAHRVVQQSTPVNTKRVVKEIDISKNNNSKPEIIVAAPKSGIELNINKKAVIVPKTTQKKEQTTSTEKVVTGPKTEMTNLEKPIVGRVIDVSIDKPKASTEVVKADTNTDPSVEVCISKAKKTVAVEAKKEEHINRISGTPIVKAEDNTLKKIKTVEVCIQETCKPDKNDSIFDEDAVKETVEKAKADKDTATITEAYREMIQSSADIIEDIDKNSLHQSNMIQADLTPSPKAMQQAIFFGDEPGGYDPDVEEEPVVKGDTDDAADEEEEDEYQITLVDSVPSDEEAESDVFYCLPRHNRVDTSKLAGIKNPIDIDPNDYRIFFKVEDTVEQIIFDYDNDSWVVMSDEPSIKLSSLDKDRIIFADSNELPEIEDAIADKYYLIKIDDGAYYAFTRDNGTKSYRFCFIVLDNDPDIEVAGDQDANDKAACVSEEAAPEVETPKSDEQDTDAMVEILKNSSKKKSLDDLMK